MFYFALQMIDIFMKKVYTFYIGVIIVVTLGGCASKEKKEAENTSATSTTLKNFERPIPPAIMTNTYDRAGYIITRYWDKFNFRDTMYCHAPDITEQAFVDFIATFPFAVGTKVAEGIKKLLDSAEVDVVMYNYFLKLAELYLYDPNSNMRNDEFYIPFLEHVDASQKVADVYKIRFRHLLQLANRNRIGTKAGDLVYTTATGQTGRLYGITAPYILLMFYNPDCKECKETTDQLKRSDAITAAVSSGRLKILAVYPDENLEIWRNHLKDYPPSWINGYDKSLTIKTNEVYDLKAIPTLYLLDSNKTVILKDTFVGYLHEFFTQKN